MPGESDVLTLTAWEAAPPFLYGAECAASASCAALSDAPRSERSGKILLVAPNGPVSQMAGRPACGHRPRQVDRRPLDQPGRSSSRTGLPRPVL